MSTYAKCFLLTVFCIAATALIPGCGRKSAEDEHPEGWQPTEFKIDQKEEVVKANDILVERADKVVREDFNMDSLEDLAIIAGVTGGVQKVDIYIQRNDPETKTRSYYKAGGIFQSGEYKITGLATRQRDSGADLVVIFDYLDDHKEMVHYRTTGTSLEEVFRQEVKENETKFEIVPRRKKTP